MASAEVDVAALYWGTIDSNVEWCEPNYVVPWAAEIVNSVTSLPISYFALIGIFCLKSVSKLNASRKYSVALFSLATVGIGSFLFHLTLRRVAQSLDELPMIYTGIAFFYNSATMPSKRSSDSSASIAAFTSLSSFLSLYGIFLSPDTIFALLLIALCIVMTAAYFLGAAFFLVFALLYSVGLLGVIVSGFTQLFPKDAEAVRRTCGASRKRRASGENGSEDWNGKGKTMEEKTVMLSYSPYPLAASLYKWAIVLYTVGFVVWLFENNFCAYLPVWLYLHGLWHILAGLGSYCMMQCHLSYHCEMLSLKHQLKWHRVWLLPFIEIQHTANSGVATMDKVKGLNGDVSASII